MKVKRVWSLGAGVQSSTGLLMSDCGEIEPVDVAVFADTGSEPKAVYLWLEWLKQVSKTPIITVQQGQGLTAAIEVACDGTAKRASSLPLFTANGGRVFRQCTWDFKVIPIRKAIKPMVGKAGCVMVRGISFDERQRAKPSDVKWARHEHPLVDMGMTRADCLRWMLKKGHPLPPRSACVYCPNRCNAEWVKMKELYPEDWAEACRVDELVRHNLPGMKEPVFLHRQKVPLKDADLYANINPDQLQLGDDGWADCEGLCGV